MKWKKLLMLGISLFAFCPLLAHNCSLCDPFITRPVTGAGGCFPYDWCDGWSASADWLYWRARKSGLDYAAKGQQNDPAANPYGKIYSVEPEYESGARVALFKSWNNFDAGIRYTWFSTGQSDSFSSDLSDVVATRGFPGDDYAQMRMTNAWAKYKVKMNKIDVEMRLPFQTCYGLFRPFAGTQFTFIDQDMKTKYNNYPTNGVVPVNVDIDEWNRLNAYGLYAGVEGVRDLICNIGLYGRFSGGLSASRFDERFQYNDATTPSVAVFAESEHWLVIPNWEVQVGLSYEFYRCCVDWTIQLGYEFHQWCCLPDFLSFDDGVDYGHLAHNKSNLGFEGLFLRVNAAF